MKGFDEFIREKTYLANVSPSTVYWYKQSFKSLGNPDPSAEDLTEWVVRLRQNGVKAESVNTYARAINCYLRWKGSSCKISKLKVPKKIPATFKPEDIQVIMKWKPKRFSERRLQALMLTLADTGTRLNEVLELKWNEVDFDNLLITVTGKGDRMRRIPFSFELRKVLYGSITSKRGRDFPLSHEKTPSQKDWHDGRGVRSFDGLVFSTRQGRKLSQRNTLRDVKLACKKIGIAIPERTCHAFRHSMAINYLRRGGSVFHLQKVLGHSDLSMTRRYANLTTEDLSSVHQRISLLSR